MALSITNKLNPTPPKTDGDSYFEPAAKGSAGVMTEPNILVIRVKAQSDESVMGLFLELKFIARAIYSPRAQTGVELEDVLCGLRPILKVWPKIFTHSIFTPLIQLCSYFCSSADSRFLPVMAHDSTSAHGTHP